MNVQELIASGTFRVLDNQNAVQGTAFLVADTLAVTCAHVIQPNLKKSQRRVRLLSCKPGQEISLEAEVLADTFDEAADIVFLRLLDLPLGMCPLPLGASMGAANHRFISYGHPQSIQSGGLWANDEQHTVSGEVDYQGQRLLQLNSGIITRGFSGAPVWDAEARCVIGMVNGLLAPDSYARLDQVSFAIPSETLIDHAPPTDRAFLAFAAQDDGEQRYLQQVIRAHNRVTLWGLGHYALPLQHIALEDVFVRLSITAEVEANLDGSLAPTWTKDMVELGPLLQKHNLLIVGEPGAGKTTLLNWLAVTFAAGEPQIENNLGFREAWWPLFISLGQLPETYQHSNSRAEPNWVEFLPEHLANHLAYPGLNKDLLRRKLTNAPCLLLFDGLDEIADRAARYRIVRSIGDLAYYYPQHRIVITSRPSGAREIEAPLSASFRRCDIEPFSENDLLLFFQFWYRLDNRLAPEARQAESDRLYQKVQQTPGLLNIATTPLFASILLLIWRNESRLPESRVELYERLCRIFLQTWEQHHDGTEEKFLAALRWEKQLNLLAPLAFAIHAQAGWGGIPVKDAISLLSSELACQGVCQVAEAPHQAEKYLDAVVLRASLVQITENDRCLFTHLTFQEYLAARHIAAQDNCLDLLMPHLHQSWWRQVYMLTFENLSREQSGGQKLSHLILNTLNAYPPPGLSLIQNYNLFIRTATWHRPLTVSQLELVAAFILDKEYELVTQAYLEARPTNLSTKAMETLQRRSLAVVEKTILDAAKSRLKDDLLTLACKILEGKHRRELVQGLRQVADHPSHIHQAYMSSITKMLKLLGCEEDALQAINRHLRSPKHLIRISGILEAREADLEIKQLSSLLLPMLEDENAEVRLAAAIALASRRSDHPKVIHVLVNDISSFGKKGVETVVAYQLARLGSTSNLALEGLHSLHHHPSPTIQQLAQQYIQVLAYSSGQADTIGEQQTEDKIELSMVLLKNQHGLDLAAQSGVLNQAEIKALALVLEQRQKALESLVSGVRLVFPAQPESTKVIFKLLRHSDGQIRGVAAEALGQFYFFDEHSLAEAVRCLTRSLFDPDEEVRSEALTSLELLLQGRAIPGYKWELSELKRNLRGWLGPLNDPLFIDALPACLMVFFIWASFQHWLPPWLGLGLAFACAFWGFLRQRGSILRAILRNPGK